MTLKCYRPASSVYSVIWPRKSRITSPFFALPPSVKHVKKKRNNSLWTFEIHVGERKKSQSVKILTISLFVFIERMLRSPSITIDASNPFVFNVFSFEPKRRWPKQMNKQREQQQQQRKNDTLLETQIINYK